MPMAMMPVAFLSLLMLMFIFVPMIMIMRMLMSNFLSFLTVIMDFTVSMIMILVLSDLFRVLPDNLITLDYHLSIVLVNLLSFALFLMTMLKIIIGY